MLFRSVMGLPFSASCVANRKGHRIQISLGGIPFLDTSLCNSKKRTAELVVCDTAAKKLRRLSRFVTSPYVFPLLVEGSTAPWSVGGHGHFFLSLPPALGSVNVMEQEIFHFLVPQLSYHMRALLNGTIAGKIFVGLGEHGQAYGVPKHVLLGLRSQLMSEVSTWSMRPPSADFKWDIILLYPRKVVDSADHYSDLAAIQSKAESLDDTRMAWDMTTLIQGESRCSHAVVSISRASSPRSVPDRSEYRLGEMPMAQAPFMAMSGPSHMPLGMPMNPMNPMNVMLGGMAPAMSWEMPGAAPPFGRYPTPYAPPPLDALRSSYPPSRRPGYPAPFDPFVPLRRG